MYVPLEINAYAGTYGTNTHPFRLFPRLRGSALTKRRKKHRHNNTFRPHLHPNNMMNFSSAISAVQRAIDRAVAASIPTSQGTFAPRDNVAECLAALELAKEAAQTDDQRNQLRNAWADYHARVRPDPRAGGINLWIRKRNHKTSLLGRM